MSRLTAFSMGLALLLGAPLNSVAMAAETMTVQLEGIADGDTIYVRAPQTQTSYRVRLAMIDAPENDQEYGVEATAALQHLLRGAGPLTLTISSTDRYGRLIAIVEDDRNRNINLAMVSQGAAWVYTKYAKSGAYAGDYSLFANAERQAKMRQIGLWQNPEAVEPWRYRRK